MVINKQMEYDYEELKQNYDYIANKLNENEQRLKNQD